MRKLTSLLFGIITLASAAATPEVIAHRGFWDTPGSAKNSVEALIKADSIGAYASEFDVWMTADSVLVINHDATYDGVDIEHSNSAEVTMLRLANGENLPSLRQFLAAARELDIRLVCEIKTHDSNAHERECIRRTMAMIKEFGLEDRLEYNTFSKNGILEIIRLTPEGTPAQYPAGDYLPEQAAAFGITGLNYRCRTLRKNPEWIARCHDLGLTVKVWKITSDDDLQWCVDNGVDFVTSDSPAQHLGLIKTIRSKQL